jgi:hypothetical protein
MKKLIIAAIMLAAIKTVNGQNIKSTNQIKRDTLETIRCIDRNKDGVISLLEAQETFNDYRSNPTKVLNNDIVEDVESLVLDLISYLEGVDCSDLKKNPATKRFIEIYYRNKFYLF